MTTATFSVSVPVESATHDALGWIKPDFAENLTKELKAFLKCVKGDPRRFLALTECGAICGSKLDSDSCKPVDRQVLNSVMIDFIHLVVGGGFKVNGKSGDWSVGFMGSRWLDMNAADYDVDYVRVAFYSKKYYNGVWPHEKPYHITITIEKAK
jgi:hypothetical protein